ncbi:MULTISPECIES: helix-turn-helix transcriptional regulator [unclassified Streptosporangium]|uniref:helix-turn-helix transcriptional regulator n=1 Tax=unclassified Streptosporangium TaxID=2632669 RepID=UPI002E29DC30|nr:MULTISPECIES: helix-turn-helix transcriptional regulator [unclassified Streptosporangium]
MSADARRELGTFLRAHRETLSPRDIGLRPGGRRRTPGLRREEVATLSGVGIAWYTWLEQGRVSASRQVLESVARTLRLDDDGLRHVLALSGLAAPNLPADPTLAARMRPILDSWPLSPALLLDRHFDLLAWNAAYAALWGDPGRIPAERRNLMWVMTGDPRTMGLLRDWEPLAMSVFQHFRGQAGPYLDDVRTGEVYALLERDRPDLTNWWQCPSVATFSTRDVVVEGPMTFVFSLLHPVEEPGALILLQTPRNEADRLRMAALTTTATTATAALAARVDPEPARR